MDLSVVSTKGATPIWDLLDPAVYGSQITLLKKAFDNLCYESYASHCEELKVPCDYFSSLDYSSAHSQLSVVPYKSEINLPENTDVTIALSPVITEEFEPGEYSLQLSSDRFAELNGNVLSIASGTIGQSFDIELIIQDLKAYSLRVTVKKEFYSGGYGSEQQPYQLSTKNDVISFLSNFSQSENYYRLAKDIDLGGEKLDVGGSSTGDAFMGIFDGADHAIRNFTVKASTFENNFYAVGIFGQNQGVIKNLIVDNARVLINGSVVINKENASVNCGILVGLNEGVVNNCRIVNSSLRVPSVLVPESARLNIGGIVGQSRSLVQYSMIGNTRVDGIPSTGKGLVCIGGLVGRLAGATLEKSYVSNSWVNAYSSGETKYSLGGLVGRLESVQNEEMAVVNATISTSLVYGLTANKNSGDFGYVAGSSDNGKCVNCYYEAKTELSISSAKANGCTRKTILNLDTIANASFADEWVDGTSGPVLIRHNVVD